MNLSEIARISGGPNCDDKSCPAIYVGEDPNVLVVQGKGLDTDTTANLTGVAVDELAVAIPREILLRAADTLRTQA
ncbi:MAG: hypothetical protein J2P23_04095 [Microlunatus sp.]|nr:hypothetical protein [Microlunatus sp.]